MKKFILIFFLIWKLCAYLLHGFDHAESLVYRTFDANSYNSEKSNNESLQLCLLDNDGERVDVLLRNSEEMSNVNSTINSSKYKCYITDIDDFLENELLTNEWKLKLSRSRMKSSDSAYITSNFEGYSLEPNFIPLEIRSIEGNGSVNDLRMNSSRKSKNKPQEDGGHLILVSNTTSSVFATPTTSTGLKMISIDHVSLQPYKNNNRISTENWYQFSNTKLTDGSRMFEKVLDSREHSYHSKQFVFLDKEPTSSTYNLYIKESSTKSTASSIVTKSIKKNPFFNMMKFKPTLKTMATVSNYKMTTIKNVRKEGALLKNIANFDHCSRNISSDDKKNAIELAIDRIKSQKKDKDHRSTAPPVLGITPNSSAISYEDAMRENIKKEVFEDPVVLDPYNITYSRQESYVHASPYNLHSYSGYIKLNHSKDNLFMFFWFILCRKDTKKKPIIIWLQGQPTASVIQGFFWENGPYILNASYLLEENEYSWSTEYNMLYLDTSVPAGYSYSEKNLLHSNDIQHITNNLLRSLEQFFTVFHEYSFNELYLAGEFEAGKIIPYAIYRMDAHNFRKKPGNLAFNIKGGIMGSPITDIRQMLDYSSYLLRWGLTDLDNERNPLNKLEQVRLAYQSNIPQDLLTYLRPYVYGGLTELGYKTYTDLRDLNQKTDFPFYDDIAFRKRIHVGNRAYYKGNLYITLTSLFKDEKILPKVLEKYKLLFYNGQFDPLIYYEQTITAICRIRWSGSHKWYRTPRINWMLDDQLVGYWKRYDTLMHAFFRNTGHYIGRFNPKPLFYLVKAFIEDQPPAIRSSDN